MHFHFWAWGALAQARQNAMLALAEQRWLGASEHQRKAGRQRRVSDRTDLWFDELGQRCVATCPKRIRPEFDLARRSRKAARIALGVRLDVLGMLCDQGHADSAGRGAELFQTYAARFQLVAIRGVDLTAPE